MQDQCFKCSIMYFLQKIRVYDVINYTLTVGINIGTYFKASCCNVQVSELKLRRFCNVRVRVQIQLLDHAKPRKFDVPLLLLRYISVINHYVPVIGFTSACYVCVNNTLHHVCVFKHVCTLYCVRLPCHVSVLLLPKAEPFPPLPTASNQFYPYFNNISW